MSAAHRDRTVRELKRAVLTDLRLEDVTVAHVRISGNVDGGNAIVRRAGCARDSEVFEKMTPDILALLRPVIVSLTKAKIIAQRLQEDRSDTGRGVSYGV